MLFGAKKPRSEKLTIKKNKANLKGIVKTKTTLYKNYKGKDYKAVLNISGKIRFMGKNYSSATAAAKAVTRGPVNGLTFWNIEDLNGDWIKLGAFITRNHG